MFRRWEINLSIKMKKDKCQEFFKDKWDKENNKIEGLNNKDNKSKELKIRGLEKNYKLRKKYTEDKLTKRHKRLPMNKSKE